MERKPPTPTCKSFTVCRQTFQDVFTKEYMLLAPTHQIVTIAFPTVVNVSIFARMTSVQGTYQLEVQLQDLEGEVIWRHRLEPPLTMNDPLAVGILNLQNLGVYFPKPGKYDLVLLANNEEVVRDVFWALLPGHPPNTPEKEPT